MVDRRSPPRPLNAQSLSDARDRLTALGSLGAGISQLLDSVAKLGDGAGETKSGQFTIGGAKGPLRASYSMRAGSLADAGIKKRAKVMPRDQQAAPVSDAPFAHNVFEAETGAMIVAEIGAVPHDTVNVCCDGAVVTIVVPAGSAAVTLARPIDPASLKVGIINGILTVNAVWSA